MTVYERQKPGGQEEYLQASTSKSQDQPSAHTENQHSAHAHADAPTANKSKPESLEVQLQPFKEEQEQAAKFHVEREQRLKQQQSEWQQMQAQIMKVLGEILDRTTKKQASPEKRELLRREQEANTNSIARRQALLDAFALETLQLTALRRLRSELKARNEDITRELGSANEDVV